MYIHLGTDIILHVVYFDKEINSVVTWCWVVSIQYFLKLKGILLACEPEQYYKQLVNLTSKESNYCICIDNLSCTIVGN